MIRKHDYSPPIPASRSPRRAWRLRILTAGILALAAMASPLLAQQDTTTTPATSTATPTPARPTDGYLDYLSMSKRMVALARATPTCAIQLIGSSQKKRDIAMFVLSSDPKTAHTRPAILIVAGLDGRRRAGIDVAVRIAEGLVKDHADLFQDTTFYILPCGNPDGLIEDAGGLLAEPDSPQGGHAGGTIRPVDDDRDGVADEDQPADLNGDGWITQIRRTNPPLDDNATHMADPAALRLLKTPTPSAGEGERAVYSLYVEGLDADGDGLIAEDPLGGVDLDRNFMHRYPEHAHNAGTMQLSEPESLALADFVISHPNIFAAITFGRHDNLINTPDAKGMDVTGQTPRELDPEDLDLYKEIGKLYKETTSQERSGNDDSAGSFYTWLYAHRGIPSFATTLWGRPDASKPPEEEKPAPAAEAEPKPDVPPPVAPTPDAAAPATDVAPTSPDTAAPAAPAPADAQPNEKNKEKKSDKNDAPKPADAEGAAWLEYSDRDRNGSGFIEWQPFDHPTLGKVEIGGFVPGFQWNPPVAELDAIAAKQTDFIVALAARRPKLSIQGPEITALASGLYQVRLGVTNDGYLPTATAMARKARALPPTILKLGIESENIVSGDRINRAWGIGGNGQRITYEWIVRASPGAEITIDISNPQLGEQTLKAQTP